MATFKLNFTHTGSGTKEDPYRIPIIPFTKTPLKPLKCDFVARSGHGEPKQELFLIGVGTTGKFGVGISNQTLASDGQTLTGEFLFYGREKFSDPEKLFVRATKYERKTESGQFVSGVSLQDSTFTWDGNYNEYWVVSFTDEEQAAYEAQFAPTAEEEKPALVKEVPAPKAVEKVELTVAEVLDNLDDFSLSELKEIEDALDAKLAELKHVVEAQAETVVRDEETLIEEPMPEPEYIPEYQDGVNFNTSFEFDGEYVLIHIDLDRVDEFGGFMAFQFDVPFVEGLDFVGVESQGTYFDKTPENDGTFNESKVINGWTWKAFRNDRLSKVRTAGFASSLNKITSDGRLATLRYKVVDVDADMFVLHFEKALLNGYLIPVNPKNPRVVVTK